MPRPFLAIVLGVILVALFSLSVRSMKTSRSPEVTAPAAVETSAAAPEVPAPAEIPTATPPVVQSSAVEQELPEPIVATPADKAVSSDQLLIADFDTGDKPNNLGGDFGAWNKDPDDMSQSCAISFETDDALGEAAGYSLKLDYDVDSENPAYNGFWMKLDGVDASAYDTVSFYVRGEGLNNFTKRIKVEMKDSANHTSPYIISGITDSWQKVQIPFARFRKIQDWKAMNEFVLVFDDMNSDPKQGTVLIDQIAFEKK